ncbi:phosphotransferase family protein [Microbacterium sp. No. 7]|uniref:phosphotransferase family protein n=1 Tax=Microbacterium sp. No. 7 TaxID=1714373 RepID=UPI0006D00B96|nr:phosphotransferase family protein [Microbacterium sp. No. 7]ALJ18840.1 aminoglycoside phosphotransferase [Microbacterium sp. No. 7]
MTTTGNDDAGLPLDPGLVAWIEREARGTLTRLDRVPGGARHEAWFIDVRRPDGEVDELFLRRTPIDPSETDDPFTLHDEAQVYRALAGSAVPVPRIVAVHPEQQAVISTRVGGATWFSQLRDPDARERVAADFMRILAGLHAIDATTIPLPQGDPSAGLRALVGQELDRWEAFYRSGPAPADPLVELGLAWLRARVPDADGPVVLVQGDTGPGNFLYTPEGVTAVLDWELAHFGDPHDDLAWVSTRAVQEPFTDFAARLRDYERAAGRPVDRDRIRYYRVFSELRIVIINHHKIGTVSPLSEVGNAIIYSTLHRRLFVEALATCEGVPLAPGEPLPAAETDLDWWYDAAIAQIGEIIVPHSTDRFVVQRSKSLARIVKFLRESHRLAPTVDRRDAETLASLMGRPVDSAAAGRAELAARIRAGGLGDPGETRRLIAALGELVDRETQVRAPAMGALARRHFDPLGDES